MSDNDRTDLTKYLAQYELLSHKVNFLEKKTDSIDDKMVTIQEGINVRIDYLDMAFRGDGRIGVFEQIRTLEGKVKYVNDDIKKEIEIIKEKQDKRFKFLKYIAIISISLLLLLIGGEVGGFKLSQVKDYFNKDNTTTSQVTEIESTEQI